MSNLKGKTALVTGASYGVGKGVALGLADAGAVVYATGRTIEDSTFDTTGRVIAISCDHTQDSEVKTLFERISQRQGRLDVLVNSVWGGYERMVENNEFTWMYPFWKQPLWRWDAMFVAGVRTYYAASALAARKMIDQGSGLIVNISFWAAQKYLAT